MLGGNKVVPWHRVIRYTREATREVDHSFRMHAEMRVWLDDGTDEGETSRSGPTGSNRDSGPSTSWSRRR